MNDDMYLQASAYLDDELTERERAQVEQDADLMRLVADMAQVQNQMINVRPNADARRSAIDAALAIEIEPVADEFPEPASNPGTTQAPPSESSGQVTDITSARGSSPKSTVAPRSAQGGHPPRWATRGLAIAAAVVGVGVVGAALFGNRANEATDAAIEAQDDAAAPPAMEAMSEESAVDAAMEEMSDSTLSGSDYDDSAEYDVGATDRGESAADTTSGDGIAEDGDQDPMLESGPGVPPEGDGSAGEADIMWELIGKDDLEVFVPDVLARIPERQWPTVDPLCEPLSEDGAPLTPLTEVNFRFSVDEPEVSAFLAVDVDRTADPTIVNVYVVEPGTCAIIASGTGTLNPNTP